MGARTLDLITAQPAASPSCRPVKKLLQAVVASSPHVRSCTPCNPRLQFWGRAAQQQRHDRRRHSSSPGIDINSSRGSWGSRNSRNINTNCGSSA